MSDIKSHQMKAGGLDVSVINFGASLQDLRLASQNMPLVLGFQEADDYQNNTSHLGATAGIYANRIANGYFEIDGKGYHLDKNENNTHTLHGGDEGCGTQLWEFVSWGNDHASLRWRQSDGHMGFPGDAEVLCHYRLDENQTLRISYEAKCDKDSFINLAHHSYFRLDDTADISQHQLQINADHYLTVDNENIPTGEMRQVTDTRFDFRDFKAVGTQEIDHNYCLTRDGNIREVARLFSPSSGIEMIMSSDQVGLQCYTADHLSESGQTHHGKSYRARDGICLEPQYWPNSPNMPQFPSSFLRAGTRYEQELQLQFIHHK